MNELQIFKHEQFGEVRTCVVQQQAYFMLNDLCKILGIANVSDCKSRLNKDGVVTSEVIDIMNRKQIATFVNESNMYKVIFQSRKEEAEKFTEWVTSEVLPSIRETGSYVSNSVSYIIENETDFAIKALTAYKEEKETRMLLEAKIEQDKHKVAFAEAVDCASNCIAISDLAKLLKIFKKVS